MAKNIVVCLDGTGQEYGAKNTNVLLLHQMLVQNENQVAFYDPGVGTFSVRDTLTGISRIWQKVLGLAFGYGLRQNVADAYAFIMQHYEPGDRIYLYGYSRGAYTARLVAALIHAVGILPRGTESLLLYALRYLQIKDPKRDFERLEDFASQFQSYPPPENMFLGLWETVSSVSWFFDRQVYSYTTKNPSVSHARHAIAIDERRTFFPITLLSESLEKQNRRQVWFPGVHSDVGGGQPIDETGLSKVALEWMVVESQKQDLEIDDDRAFEVFAQQAPDPYGPRHESLTGPWWAVEFWPKRKWNPQRRRWGRQLNLGRRRRKPHHAVIHASTELRTQATSYAPQGFSQTEVEPRVPFSSRDGSRTLPPWEPPPENPGPESKDSFSWTTPIVATASYYALLTIVAAPLVLLWWAIELDLWQIGRDILLWPAWLADRVREIWDSVSLG